MWYNQIISAMRPMQGEYVDGIWVEYPGMTFSLSTSVQPTRPSDVLLLPEGRRVEASYTLYSKQKVLEKDQVVIKGSRYEILHVGPWKNGLINHFKSVAVKMQEEGVT